MYDSPLEWCAACKDWVALDQTFAECARRRGCRRGSCPLVAFLRSDEEPRPSVLNEPATELH